MENFECEWEGKIYRCEGKIFENPSMWGIDNGRISKLYIYDDFGNIIWGYERGWPEDRKKIPPMGMLDKIVAMFPNPK